MPLQAIAAPQSTRLAEMILLYDLATLINASYQQNIEPTQAGHVPKRIASKLQPLLKGAPHIGYDNIDRHLELLFTLMLHMDLLKLSSNTFMDEKARYVPGPHLEEWAEMDTLEQTEELLEQWTEDSRWYDVVGVNYTPPAWFWIDPREGRAALLQELVSCKAGEWYSIDSLLELMWNEHLLLLRPDRKYISKTQQRDLRRKKEQWMEADGEIYIGMLSSTLFELGVVHLGYQQEELGTGEEQPNPSAFQLTELGVQTVTRMFLRTPSSRNSVHTVGSNGTGEAVPLVERQRGKLIVQPSFELLVLEPDFPTLYSVLPFVQVQQIGTASRLKVTQTSLLRGLKAGMTIAQIIQTLERESQRELPQNVVYMLRDWAKQYKEVSVSQVLLLEVPDEEVAERLRKLAVLKDHGARLIAPTILAINGDTRVQTVKNALEKEGLSVQMRGSFISQQNRSEAAYGRY